MNSLRRVAGAPAWRTAATVALVATLAACQGTSKPKPAELPANPASFAVKQAWKIQGPAVDFAMSVDVSGDTVTMAGADGTVVAIDARNGKELWRASAGAPLEAGVGSDGTLTAVVTRDNDLVTLSGGKVLWTKRLGAEAYTPPLVAGRRVFVQTADRATSAWDGQSGRRLWLQSRPAESLVLRRPGVLTALDNTLIAGLGGRLAGIDPANGGSRWEAPIAAPRGTNDVERLVDITGPLNRVGGTLCARAYYVSVGCVDATRGTLLWSKPASGAVGIAGDESAVYGTEANGEVIAWRRTDGDRLWSNESYKYRSLTAPLAVGRSVVFGEESGWVHFLSRTDGSVLNRISPDGSKIAATPVLAANTVVVVTAKGAIVGYRPE